jgi:AcrR family transcriptional regulator
MTSESVSEKLDLQVHKLTRKGMATRCRIIEGAVQEIRTNGVAVTTLDDILARTRTSKSQLFHYFPGGREELLLAVAEYEADLVFSEQEPYLNELTSWTAWERWRDVVVDRHRAHARCCPIAVLLAELGRSSPSAQALTNSVIKRLHDQIASGIVNMQSQGKVPLDVDANRTAAALLAGIQGGAGILAATGDAGFLEAAIDGGIYALRNAGK